MTESPLNRLAALADEHGVTIEVALARLLDRDPHDHAHACPTCARMARAAERREQDEGQLRLIEDALDELIEEGLVEVVP